MIRTHYIYVSKDVRIRGYFSKPKGAREQKSLGSTALYSSSFPRCSYQKDQGAQPGQLPKTVRCFGNRGALGSEVRSPLFNNIRLPLNCNLKIHVLGKVHPTSFTYRRNVLSSDKTVIDGSSRFHRNMEHFCRATWCGISQDSIG